MRDGFGETRRFCWRESSPGQREGWPLYGRILIGLEHFARLAGIPRKRRVQRGYLPINGIYWTRF